MKKREKKRLKTCKKARLEQKTRFFWFFCAFLGVFWQNRVFFFVFFRVSTWKRGVFVVVILGCILCIFGANSSFSSTF